MPTKRRATVSKSSNPAEKNTPPTVKGRAHRRTSSKRVKQLPDSDHLDSDEQFTSADEGDDYKGKNDEDGLAEELDSDALDDDDGHAHKRKRASAPKKSPRKAAVRKRRRRDESEEDEWDEEDIGEGCEVVGKVVQAPKTGRVPPGQISKNTFDFLSQLMKPECNDRQWYGTLVILCLFYFHPFRIYYVTEPVYRLAEQEWKDFVDKFTENIVEVDPQVPPLPPKDVIHRIYRDVRFRADKTPYKTNLSATFSRSGRKGIFAVFKPGDQSLLAAGSWCPGRNELQTIRTHIQRNSSRLRRVLSAPRFIELFGEPKPGARRSIFGLDDELKVAPKGIDKNHKDIDLLKCRSFAVVHYFSDKDVLKPDFREQIMEVVRVVRPLVYWFVLRYFPASTLADYPLA
ncbi:hypothetical protein K488DRAFT_60325 [Vararia minispora EC-137]|uniref:Uncharacterized protein n=1 Tax=Vararia minispora EC-137 TaxID=1314806 RepID=A0ACB8Q845_9AGAM|nr:hypothetical protein K488DRAFT_60325 [Vararia minispora EC-137]